MTGQERDAAAAQDVGRAAVRLRGDRPRVTRLSRKVLGALSVCPKTY